MIRSTLTGATSIRSGSGAETGQSVAGLVFAGSSLGKARRISERMTSRDTQPHSAERSAGINKRRRAPAAPHVTLILEHSGILATTCALFSSSSTAAVC